MIRSRSARPSEDICHKGMEHTNEKTLARMILSSKYGMEKDSDPYENGCFICEKMDSVEQPTKEGLTRKCRKATAYPAIQGLKTVKVVLG